MKQLLFIISSLILWAGCSSQSSSSENIRAVVNISKYNLRYELPYPESSIIAPDNNLTDNVLMCVVDTLNEVSVLLLNLPIVPQNYIEAENIIKLISGQNSPEYTITTSDKIDTCEFLNTHAWNFQTDITIKNNTDSLQVMFYGYLFDNLGVVATSTFTDSIAPEFFIPYIMGLKRSVN